MRTPHPASRAAEYDDDNAKSKHAHALGVWPRLVVLCLGALFVCLLAMALFLPQPARPQPPWLNPAKLKSVAEHIDPDTPSTRDPVDNLVSTTRETHVPGGPGDAASEGRTAGARIEYRGRCTLQQAAKQGRFAEAAKVRGCPGKDDLWMRIIHMVMPQARLFIDIGSNKGFTAARFYELWNPELGIDAKVVHNAHRSLSPSSKELTECGACSDCTEVSRPFISRASLLCSLEASSSSDVNSEKRVAQAVETLCKERVTVFDPIRVFSFDGNSDMVRGVQLAINSLAESLSYSTLSGVDKVPKERLPNKPGRKLHFRWTVEHAAFLDSYEEGKTVTFVLGLGELGHVGAGENDAPDRSKIKTFEPTRKVVVPVLTVDALVELKALAHIDILKIDTEGSDPMVLRGARKTLDRSGATVVIFEYHKYWKESLKTVVAELETQGYACYLEGKNALLKLSFGCWSEELELKKWSNVWCLAVKLPAGAAIATIFDGYALAFV